MRNFLIAAVLMAATPALADTQAWVQAVASGGYEARALTSEANCPLLKSDQGDVAMTVRAPENGAFPLTCAAALPASAKNGSVGGVMLPLPVATPNRILVLGDTGCRIKGSALQACNDPAAWPFPDAGCRRGAVEARSCHPCRRLSLPGRTLSHGQCRLRGFAVG